MARACTITITGEGAGPLTVELDIPDRVANLVRQAFGLPANPSSPASSAPDDGATGAAAPAPLAAPPAGSGAASIPVPTEGTTGTPQVPDVTAGTGAPAPMAPGQTVTSPTVTTPTYIGAPNGYTTPPNMAGALDVQTAPVGGVAGWDCVHP